MTQRDRAVHLNQQRFTHMHRSRRRTNIIDRFDQQYIGGFDDIGRQRNFAQFARCIILPIQAAHSCTGGLAAESRTVTNRVGRRYRDTTAQTEDCQTNDSRSQKSPKRFRAHLVCWSHTTLHGVPSNRLVGTMSSPRTTLHVCATMSEVSDPDHFSSRTSTTDPGGLPNFYIGTPSFARSQFCGIDHALSRFAESCSARIDLSACAVRPPCRPQTSFISCPC